jgi:DNA-binding protein
VIFRRHTNEDAVTSKETPEQRIIDARTKAVSEKVDAAHQALDRFLREAKINGAR